MRRRQSTNRSRSNAGGSSLLSGRARFCAEFSQTRTHRPARFTERAKRTLRGHGKRKNTTAHRGPALSSRRGARTRRELGLMYGRAAGMDPHGVHPLFTLEPTWRQVVPFAVDRIHRDRPTQRPVSPRKFAGVFFQREHSVGVAVDVADRNARADQRRPTVNRVVPRQMGSQFGFAHAICRARPLQAQGNCSSRTRDRSSRYRPRSSDAPPPSCTASAHPDFWPTNTESSRAPVSV
jgi:hypothetical protein